MCARYKIFCYVINHIAKTAMNMHTILNMTLLIVDQWIPTPRYFTVEACFYAISLNDKLSILSCMGTSARLNYQRLTSRVQDITQLYFISRWEAVWEPPWRICIHLKKTKDCIIKGALYSSQRSWLNTVCFKYLSRLMNLWLVYAF